MVLVALEILLLCERYITCPCYQKCINNVMRVGCTLFVPVVKKAYIRRLSAPQQTENMPVFWEAATKPEQMPGGHIRRSPVKIASRSTIRKYQQQQQQQSQHQHPPQQHLQQQQQQLQEQKTCIPIQQGSSLSLSVPESVVNSNSFKASNGGYADRLLAAIPWPTKSGLWTKSPQNSTWRLLAIAFIAGVIVLLFVLSAAFLQPVGQSRSNVTIASGGSS